MRRQRILLISIFSRKAVGCRGEQFHFWGRAAGREALQGWYRWPKEVRRPRSELAQAKRDQAEEKAQCSGHRTHQLNKGKWTIWAAVLEDFWEIYYGLCRVKHPECLLWENIQQKITFFSRSKYDDESSSKVHPLTISLYAYIHGDNTLYIYAYIHVYI